MPTDISHASTAGSEANAPLVFAFSKSKVQGVHSLLNLNRLAMGAALVGTAANFKSGFDHNNEMRMMASAVGLYANVIEIIFSGVRPASLGELSLNSGTWEQQNGKMCSTLSGKLPERAQEEIQKLLKDGTLPINAVTISYDRTKNTTTISIDASAFAELQQELHEKLRLRQQGIKALLDPGRRIDEHTASSGAISGISLDGLPLPVINSLRDMLKNDHEITTDIALQGNHHVLTIAEDDQQKFSALTSCLQPGKENHIRVRNNQNETYAPGFVETFFRPDKHPKQHGILIGAILSNALRVGAGFKEEKMKGGVMMRSPLESYSSIWSMITYLIDFMPEPKKKDAQIVAGVQCARGPIENALAALGDELNQRPLLTSMVIKGPTVAMRVKDAYSKDDMPKKIGAAMDGLRAILTATLHKDDYGR